MKWDIDIISKPLVVFCLSRVVKGPTQGTKSITFSFQNFSTAEKLSYETLMTVIDFVVREKYESEYRDESN